MYKKLIVTTAIMAAIAGCGGSSDSSPEIINSEGSVAISGTAESGQELTATLTDENGLPDNITITWSADGTVIDGETDTDFDVTDAQIGATITVNMVYTDNDGFDEDVTSAATAAVVAAPAVNDGASVAITGTAQDGSTLTATVTDADGVSGTIAFQWAADGTDIAGATDSTFLLTATQIGAAITVTATYTDDDGFDETPTSAATGVVVAAAAVNDGASVAITGTAQDGSTLTATVTDADGVSGTIAFQWAADGTDIAGATDSTFLLTAAQVGAAITVTATYTDDDGFDETPTSAATAAVIAANVNSVGTITIDGDVLATEVVTATITDGNGTGTVNFQWQADGADIAGATSATFTITAAELGKVLSVDADYTDNDGFAEDITATHTDIVFSFIATGETSLVAALTAAADGDFIGLDTPAAGDDYADMADITVTTDNLTIRLAANSTAVITGITCLLFETDGLLIDGLVFDDLTHDNTGVCLGPDGSLNIDGNANIVRNSQFLGDQNPRPAAFGDNDEYHYMTVGGTNSIVERNLFTNKTTLNNFEGSAISMFINDTVGSDEGNIVRFNLFKDFGDNVTGSRDSNTFAVQVGRSTGDDALGDGNHIVQNNRFDNINTNRRLIMVQGGGNTIDGNTIVNSIGNLALENGFGNTVTKNIIISNAELSEDGGISFAPLGHTITDNYIGNTTSTSSDRAGLHIDSDPLDVSSSTTILANAALDLTTVVARNTVINNDTAIQFEDGTGTQCTLFNYLLDFDNNLIANQSAANNIFGSNSGDGDPAIEDQGYEDDGCSIDVASDFDNNHIYSATISETGNFDFNGVGTGVDGNIGVDGSEDGATLTAPDANLLVEGTGPDAGIGVDIDILTFLVEANVGPNTTFDPSGD